MRWGPRAATVARMGGVDRGRLRAAAVAAAVVGGICAGVCALAVAVGAAGVAFRESVGTIGYLPMAAAVWIGSALIATAVLVRRTWARRGALRWAGDHGGDEDLERTEWPWSDPSRPPDAVTVHFAVRAVVRDMAVVLAEVAWRDNGLGWATTGSSGHGIAAVGRLPDGCPDMAVEARRSPASRGADPFTQRFRILISDPGHADRIDLPALRLAHVSGGVPPWTIRAGELSIVLPGRFLSRRRAGAAADRLRRVAELVGAAPGQHQRRPPGWPEHRVDDAGARHDERRDDGDPDDVRE